MAKINNSSKPVAWHVNEWCADVRILATTFYKLVKENRIKTAKIGKRTLVLTSPADFVASLAE